MKNFKLIFLVFFATFLNAEYNLEKDYMLACTIHSYDKVQQNKIKSSVATSTKLFDELFNGELEVKIDFFESEDELLEVYKEYKDYNTAVFYLNYYLNNKDEIDSYSKDYYAFSSKDKFFSYVLVASNDSGINRIKDLKGKRYVNFTADENLASWLDYQTLRISKKPYKKVISTQIDVSKASRALLNIFFDKADFTLVKKEVYENMLLLNPAMKKAKGCTRITKNVFIWSWSI